jgi:hypothetical protein
MSTLVTIPDKLAEEVKTVTTMELDQFLITAAHKELRQIRARQLREEYERTHDHRTPHQVYERTVAQAIIFEAEYGLSSDQFLEKFEAGVIDEHQNDWVVFYRWRTIAYGLQRMEKEYGFTREMLSDAPSSI